MSLFPASVCNNLSTDAFFVGFVGEEESILSSCVLVFLQTRVCLFVFVCPTQTSRGPIDWQESTRKLDREVTFFFFYF